MLHVSVEDLGENVILHCAGRIVRGDETGILCAALRQRGRNIMVDLSEVKAIDAAGVGALISLRAAGIYLQLLNPTKAVREVLRITKLDTVFEISSAPQMASRPENCARGFPARTDEGARASIA